ncbi:MULTISPECIES: DUF6338 family protein [unclassified Sphingobium]|uniref:DUF6338 family protein n=1 Tax=unclassified Sphingobium TaxID=2611147 RepID=UPI0022244974|nr:MULTISPECIES: DUF6338 family protein [unclassified Sphingobium]MCW2412954.1 hypothetical protein [Sphingobium sp. B8D3D]MCW2414748.1 hypothetical protein [Sphingobium sp. B8D3A]
MPDIPSASEIAKLTGLLAPGIVILWVRSRFRDVSQPEIADKLISYALVSIAYSAASYPLFHAEGWIVLPAWLWQLLLYFVLPLIVGVLLVFFDQSERFYALATKAGLRPVHHTPTAWDYTFRRGSPAFVLVHLTDGSEIAGAWVEGSFASSTSGDRDVFINQMWTVTDGGWQVVDPPRSILICGGTISMVEFIQGGPND